MSICSGVDEIIDRHLDVGNIGTTAPHYAHKASALNLGVKPARLDATQMLADMLMCVEANWDQAPRRKYADPSAENWRFKKQLSISDKNTSAEKILEKAIARVMPGDWANQIPTASGLFDATSDRHRNIDLVHRLHPGCYEFIELKVESDTPLKAAMEVVVYGVLYVFSRVHLPDVYRQSKEILQAKEIHLQVLAPRSYYNRYHLKWVGPTFNVGFQSLLAERSLDIKVDLQLMAFPSAFAGSCPDEQLPLVLKEASPVVWY